MSTTAPTSTTPATTTTAGTQQQAATRKAINTRQLVWCALLFFLLASVLWKVVVIDRFMQLVPSRKAEDIKFSEVASGLRENYENNTNDAKQRVKQDPNRGLAKFAVETSVYRDQQNALQDIRNGKIPNELFCHDERQRDGNTLTVHIPKACDPGDGFHIVKSQTPVLVKISVTTKDGVPITGEPKLKLRKDGGFSYARHIKDNIWECRGYVQFLIQYKTDQTITVVDKGPV